jgi:ribosomal subunit interface protein
MQIPLRITMQGMSHSDALDERIRDKAEKLERFHPNVTGCDVAIAAHERRHRQGRRLDVRVTVHVPGHEIVVHRDQHEDAHAAVRDAFEAAARRLGDLARMERGEVKPHAPRPRAAAIPPVGEKAAPEEVQ